MHSLIYAVNGNAIDPPAWRAYVSGRIAESPIQRLADALLRNGRRLNAALGNAACAQSRRARRRPRSADSDRPPARACLQGEITLACSPASKSRWRVLIERSRWRVCTRRTECRRNAPPACLSHHPRWRRTSNMRIPILAGATLCAMLASGPGSAFAAATLGVTADHKNITISGEGFPTNGHKVSLKVTGQNGTGPSHLIKTVAVIPLRKDIVRKPVCLGVCKAGQFQTSVVQNKDPCGGSGGYTDIKVVATGGGKELASAKATATCLPPPP
jgi:hypothetical protein